MMLSDGEECGSLVSLNIYCAITCTLLVLQLQILIDDVRWLEIKIFFS